jgi:hypothetical protein
MIINCREIGSLAIVLSDCKIRVCVENNGGRELRADADRDRWVVCQQLYLAISRLFPASDAFQDHCKVARKVKVGSCKPSVDLPKNNSGQVNVSTPPKSILHMDNLIL